MVKISRSKVQQAMTYCKFSLFTVRWAKPPGGRRGDPVQNFSSRPFSSCFRSATSFQNQVIILSDGRQLEYYIVAKPGRSKSWREGRGKPYNHKSSSRLTRVFLFQSSTLILETPERSKENSLAEKGRRYLRGTTYMKNTAAQ